MQHKLRMMIAVLFFFAIAAKGQNMVPNTGFEARNACPSNPITMPYSAGYNYFPTVLNWSNPVKKTSPDYLNTCAPTASGFKIPATVFGYKQTHNGDAAAGIIAWEGTFMNGNPVFDYREYLQNRLSQPMIAGQQYCVSFYVSPAINTHYNINFVALQQIGINFSASRPVDTVNYTLSLPYDIQNKQNNFISDTAIWYKISGVYTAKGSEQWLTLGCFNNGGVPLYQQAYPTMPIAGVVYRSYLFIDDVQVRKITPKDTTYLRHDTISCDGSGFSMTLTAPSDALAYHWNTGATSSVFIAKDTGLYWCQSILACGIQVDSFYINYQPAIQFTLGNDVVNCLGQSVTLKPNGVFNNYTWSNGASTPQINVAQSGLYWLTASDLCGTYTDSILVTIQSPTPPPIAHDTQICQGSPMPILNVIGTNLVWYPPGGGTGSHTQPYFPTSQYGKHTFYVAQRIGACESVAVPLVVNILYKPNLKLIHQYTLCAGQDTLIGNSYPDVQYLWSTLETTCCIHPNTAGDYSLTISNACGTSTDTTHVAISPCDECLWVPNAFTPNNDGRNDFFIPIAKCPIKDFMMSIYDRWGNKVFTTASLNIGWNGYLKNERLAVGNYVYVIQYTAQNTGNTKRVQGNCLLIR